MADSAQGSTVVGRSGGSRLAEPDKDETCRVSVVKLSSSNAIGHTESGDQGPAQFKAAREGLLNAFPDIKVEVEGTAADGDHVIVRWHARATHLGPGLGLPATNRKVDFRGMTWLTFKNGVIVEGWDSWNLGRLLESLR
jgi:predicted ester cyclase